MRKILFCAGIVFFVAAIVFPVLTKTTNCGGNSYALSACASFTAAAGITAQENHSHFEINKMGKMEWKNISMIAKDSWGVLGTDLLIKTNFELGTKIHREAVIVCSRKFGNVPQPTIWNCFHQNQAHAVGYSDGAIGLISPTEFSNLNLSGFVSAASLATNSEFAIFKK